MTLEQFNNLEDQEKETFLSSFDQKKIEDLEAERDSFQTELEGLRKEFDSLKDEHKRTKEMNFTLARKLNVEDKKAQSVEDILHDMFKKEG